MLTNDLTKFGKCKKHPLLLALKKLYSAANKPVHWIGEKLVLDQVGWFTTELACNTFPITYVCFFFRERNLTLKIQANTLPKLLVKLEAKCPELLPNHQKN
jgi:hypothetical protein